MSYKTLSTLALVSLLFSCQDEAAKKEPAADAAKPAAAEQGINCYEYINQADTVTLRLIHTGESISGILVYHLDGKDANKGTLQGNMRDSLLVANYSFMSEGMTSERQVVFKLDQGSLVEGYGERVVQNDKETFKDLSSLKFDSQIRLSPVECK
ncbi:hypothetical protein [Paraflavitalea pollutisoli]|uniref:hypothetical protein n=1 Tax=Paraflavitalea pollutisoli TaxID=3034143 RepID=UPI0023ED8C9A|nr:hypothetical protein [Paraflavitalea sp. H1-2-19X]